MNTLTLIALVAAFAGLIVASVVFYKLVFIKNYKFL